MRSSRRCRLTRSEGASATEAAGALVAGAFISAPPSLHAAAPASESLHHRMGDDEGQADSDEPREQVPRSTDYDIRIAVDGGRVTEQMHDLRPRIPNCACHQI